MDKSDGRKNIARPVRERISNFWYYYKWLVIGGMVAMILIGTFIYDFINVKEPAFTAVLLNTSQTAAADAYEQEFVEYAGINTEECAVVFNADLSIHEEVDVESIEASQYIATRAATGELDVAVMDPATFAAYSSELFMDLRKCLTDKDLEALEGKLIYLDAAGEKQAVSCDPEAMQEPVPVGIKLNECAKFLSVYPYADGDCILGICATGRHLDYTRSFLSFLFEDIG